MTWHLLCWSNLQQDRRWKISAVLWVVEVIRKETCGFLQVKYPSFKEEVLRYVGHQAKFTIILSCAEEVNNMPAHSQLMRCTIISFSNLWLYYFLNVSEDMNNGMSFQKVKHRLKTWKEKLWDMTSKRLSTKQKKLKVW